MSDSEIWAEKTTDTGRRITRLLVTDVEAFVHGEIRRRFVEAPALADALDDEAIAGLKTRTQALADARSKALAQAIEHDNTWLSAHATDPAAPVTAIPAVGQAITDLEQAVTKFLADEGFPADEPVGYRLPGRFIDGENLATLTRNLWKYSRYHQAAQAAREEQKQVATAETRARRWDDA
ncbi:MAG: hypothetical protein R3F65_26580 [bacterium]